MSFPLSLNSWPVAVRPELMPASPVKYSYRETVPPAPAPAPAKHSKHRLTTRFMVPRVTEPSCSDNTNKPDFISTHTAGCLLRTLEHINTHALLEVTHSL